MTSRGYMMRDRTIRRTTRTNESLGRMGVHRHRAAIVAVVTILSTVSAVVVAAPFADASAHSSGSWALIGANPWPGISSFGGVSCPTTSDCWVVGTTQGGAGAVFATTNGRKFWSSETLPGGVSSLDSISCPTTMDCWATGVVNGEPGIISTDNAGASWGDETIPSLQYLTGLVEISCPAGQSSDCWTVGSDNEPETHAFYILSTTNGGGTWTYTTGPESATSISCPSTSTCVIGVDNYEYGLAQAEVTNNGGESWNVYTFPNSTGSPASVSCASASSCWAVGSITEQGIPEVEVEQGTDGGTSWSTEATFSSGTFLTGISCPTTSDCWIVGTNTSSDTGLMMASTDGGSTWKPGTLPISIEDASIVSCAAPYVCSAAGTTSSGAVMMGTVVQVTTLSLPGATRGTEYSYQLQATGGRPPYRGQLPREACRLA